MLAGWNSYMNDAGAYYLKLIPRIIHILLREPLPKPSCSDDRVSQLHCPVAPITGQGGQRLQQQQAPQVPETSGLIAGQLVENANGG